MSDDESKEYPSDIPPVMPPAAHGPSIPVGAERFRLQVPCGDAEFERLRSAALDAKLEKETTE